MQSPLHSSTYYTVGEKGGSTPSIEEAREGKAIPLTDGVKRFEGMQPQQNSAEGPHFFRANFPMIIRKETSTPGSTAGITVCGSKVFGTGCTQNYASSMVEMSEMAITVITSTATALLFMAWMTDTTRL